MELTPVPGSRLLLSGCFLYSFLYESALPRPGGWLYFSSGKGGCFRLFLKYGVGLWDTLFSAKLITSKLVNLANDSGMFPLRLLRLKAIVFTLPAFTKIPNQVDNGALVNQRYLSTQCGPSVLLYKSTNASESLISTWAFVVIGLLSRIVNVNNKQAQFFFIQFNLIWFFRNVIHKIFTVLVN